MVVFDFDKTLIDKDTIWGFYKEVNENNHSFGIKRGLYFIFVIFYKMRLISNTGLKKAGVFLFLRGKKKEYILQRGVSYAKSLTLNQVYHQDYRTYNPESRWVISASFEEYLINVFPEDKVVASQLMYKNEKVIGLACNMFGSEKLKYIESLLQVEAIDVFYTDSYSDRPLMDVAKNVYMIKNGEKALIKGLEND